MALFSYPSATKHSNSVLCLPLGAGHTVLHQHLSLLFILPAATPRVFFVTSWAYVLKTIFIANNPVKWKDDVFPWKFSSADLLAVL